MKINLDKSCIGKKYKTISGKTVIFHEELKYKDTTCYLGSIEDDNFTAGMWNPNGTFKYPSELHLFQLLKSNSIKSHPNDIAIVEQGENKNE